MVLLALVLIVGFLGVLDRATPIHYYRPINDYAIAVGTTTGSNTWTRITGVVETDSSVTVYVKSWSAPVPSATDYVYELTALLSNPLGSRTVIDGSSGLPVSQLKPTPA